MKALLTDHRKHPQAKHGGLEAEPDREPDREREREREREKSEGMAISLDTCTPWTIFSLYQKPFYVNCAPRKISLKFTIGNSSDASAH